MAEKNGLYNFDKEENIKKKKTIDKKEKKKKKYSKKSSNQINADNEIIIGVTLHEDPKKKEKDKKNKKNNKKQVKTKKIENKKQEDNIKKRNANKKKVIKKDNNEINVLFEEPVFEIKSQKNKRPRKKGLFVKIFSIIVLLVGITIITLLSPVFNIKKINVIGNSLIESEKIIGMSNILIGENMFKIKSGQARKNIKQNGYIDNVKIIRKIPDEIEIQVEERVPKYAIEFGNGYVILNNQGYIVEISSEKKDVPNIIGTVTSEEKYKENERLDDEDLSKLNVVLKILSSAKAYSIDDKISSIDITDMRNIKINLDSEQKVAYMGDCSNLESRIQWLKVFIEREEKAGEIIINMNLNVENPYFRESIR